jgi:putative hemolysin
MGAYRMGRTDELRKSGRVYLSEMFDFDDAFYADHPASLEMGRSFVTPEYQKNYYSLHLLWRGIGAYLRLYPQYRRLYGTVSLSRQYDLRSICVMCDALIEPSALVTPRWPLDTGLGPEWANYRDQAGTVKLDQVSAIVRSLEKDGKDIPILLRHYYKLGAKFLAVGVDPNFNHTPGLLLSVSIDDMPENKRKSYISQPAAIARLPAAIIDSRLEVAPTNCRRKLRTPTDISSTGVPMPERSRLPLRKIRLSRPLTSF